MAVEAYQKATRGRAGYIDWLNKDTSDTGRYELVDGELLMVAVPRLKRYWAIEYIYRKILALDPEGSTGLLLRENIAVRLDPNTNIFMPDLYFFKADNPPYPDPFAYIGVPDFVLEVWAKPYKKKVREKKLKIFQGVGVSEYWELFIDESSLTIWRAPDYQPEQPTGAAGAIIESVTIPGLRLDFDSLLAFVDQVTKR